MTSILCGNKFTDIYWEIIFDESSNFTDNISQVKILLKISYINMNTLNKGNLNLILDEHSFNVNNNLNYKN